MTNKLRKAALEALKELQQLRPQNQSPFWFRITEDLRAALAQPAASGEPAVIYSPVATKPQVAGRHPNDNETADPERAYWLSLRGDDAGQGLDPYWKWGHKAGWNDHKKHATAQPTPALVPLTDEQALEIAVTATPPGSMASRHQIVKAIRLAERHHGIFPSKESPL